ncbi:Hexaprenyldihydroxybenzoate methyltransferase, mitochondrial [Lithohypha guttulata]|nr:Hexaprenyldihydroxybenzoate methyltransferase, mitochondrial [Lithohypha guttulata]
MNPLRHDFIQSCLRSASSAFPNSNDAQNPEATRKYKYLDVGCGGGIFASSAARLPNTVSVTAIDPTSEVIKYLNCAIEELDSHIEGQGKESFDFVTVFEVVEHIDKPAAFLRQALAHLKPGGWLIGSTIARHPMSYLTTKIVAEAPWPIGVVPPGTHDWNKYVNPSEVREWFAHENHELHTRNVETSDNEGRIEAGDKYGVVRVEGCIYLPLLGWKWAGGTAEYGNFFFGVQKLH